MSFLTIYSETHLITELESLPSYVNVLHTIWPFCNRIYWFDVVRGCSYCCTMSYIRSSLPRRPPLVHSIRFSFPSLDLSGGSAIQWHQSTHTVKASRSLTGEPSPSYRRLDLSWGRRPTTDTQDVSTSHEGDVHPFETCLYGESYTTETFPYGESPTIETFLYGESHTTETFLYGESPPTETFLYGESSITKTFLPLLKRSSIESFQLNRMFPFRHLFTAMCYYNRCSDLLRQSLPHATINWCLWLDFKNVIPHIFEQTSSRKEKLSNVVNLLQYWPILSRDNWSNCISPLSFMLSS